MDANLYNSGNWGDFDAVMDPNIVPFEFSASSSTQNEGFSPWCVPNEEIIEEKTASVSRSHSQAEKRRRDRINAQLTALRKMIPKSDKMDKAALLGSAIEQVKDLKRKAAESCRNFPAPSEIDEVTVDRDSEDDGNVRSGTIRASLCCDDRPEVLTELIRVLNGLKLSTVSAEIAMVGGRMKSNLILRNKKDDQETVSLTTVKQSLNLVLSRIASSSAGSSYRIRSKRQRMFFASAFDN